MIEKFPAAIEKAANEALPADFRLWWVRAIVLEVREVEHPSGDEKLRHLRDMVLKVGDVDNPDDGYEVRIEGNYHNFEDGDPISLLGHERCNAERVSHPRLCINHCTQTFDRIYAPAARLRFGVVPAVQYKHWLAAWRPKDKSMRAGCTLYVVFFGGLLAYALLKDHGLLMLGFALLGAVLFLLAPAIISTLVLRWLINLLYGQPRFSFEPKYEPLLIMQNYRDFMNYKRQDLTPLYEKLAHLVDAEVQAHPAPDLDFVPVHRGTHMVGGLTPKAPRKVPVPVENLLDAQPIATA